MDKMRWFIIGNLIGFGVLICGIGINEGLKHRATEQTTDQPTEQQTDKQKDKKSGQHSPSAEQTGAATEAATGTDTGTNTGTEAGEDARASSSGDSKGSSVNSQARKSSVANKENGVKTEGRLVTTRDISKGTILHAGDVELRQVDVKRASKDGLTIFDTALGHKTRIDLVEGEMLQPADLEAK